MVKKFVQGIYPNRFGKNIDMLCIKNLNVCKKTFMSMYNNYFKARNTLKGADGMDNIKVSVGSSTLGRSATVMTPAKSVAVVTPAHLQPAKGNHWNNAPRVEVPQKGTHVKVNEKVCFHCYQTGHIRPDCPLRTPKSMDKNKNVAKLGIMKIENEDRAPVVIVDN